MVVQHPLLWAMVLLAGGIVCGTYVPSLLYVPLLAASLLAATFLWRSDHWHDVLTIVIWFLLGCSRVSISYFAGPSEKPVWYETIEEKAHLQSDRLIRRLQASGLEEQSLSLSSALILGRRNSLGKDIRYAYQKVGASHLLALSGMHLGIIFGLLYEVLIRPVRHSRWRWHVLPIIFICIWGYAFLVGMPVSLMRATIMLSILSVVMLRQGHTDNFNPLSISAICILILYPNDLFNIGFQLSYAAVFFIIALHDRIYLLIPYHHKLLSLFWMSCMAQLGTTPLVAYYFHAVPVLSPLLSLLLVPLTTFIIYLSILTLILPVAPLAMCVNWLVSIQNSVIEAAGFLPFATINNVYPDKVVLFLIYAILFIAIIRLRTMDTYIIEQENKTRRRMKRLRKRIENRGKAKQPENFETQSFPTA